MYSFRTLKPNAIILLIFIIPMLIVAFININKTLQKQDVLSQTFKDKLIKLVSTADRKVNYFENMYIRKELTREAAEYSALEAIDLLSDDTDLYFFVLDDEGIVLRHPLSYLEGHHIDDENIRQWVKRVNKNKSGFTEYTWEGEEKITYGIHVDTFDWTIAAGDNPTQVKAKIMQEIIALCIRIAFLTGLTFISAVLITKFIKKK